MDDPSQQSGPAEAIALHSIRPEFCPECGYNLSGLPNQGACPECGVAYGQEIVVYGWGVDAYATFINRKPYPLFTLVLVLAALLFALLPLMALLLWWPLGLIGALMYVRYGINLYRRYRGLAVVPAPVQLRLAAQGYSVRIGCGPPRWLSWDWVYAVLVEERQIGKHYIAIHRVVADGVAERDCAIELEVDISAEAVRRIAQLREGPLSDALCIVRSLPPR